MGGGPSADSVNSDITSSSIESMVEIRRTPALEQSIESQKYRLVYSRSKVYIHPTPYSRDNIPGFVAIVRKEAISTSFLIAWIPESLLDEKGPQEWDKFLKIEGAQELPPDDDDTVLIELPTARGESYAFSIDIGTLYSMIVHPPSLSSWYGSIAFHLTSGNTLPTLYFHDDESRSASATRGTATWGGEDLLQRIRSYANILRSTLQTSLFLVDPSRADIEAHSTILYSDDAVDEILSPSSPIPRHRQPRPQSLPPPGRTSLLHQTFPGPSAGMALLQTFSNVTRATMYTAQKILSHPLARPILPHLPDPVKSLVNAEWSSWLEKGGVGEYEGARVYLAKWARIVAEEGERSRQTEAQSSSSADEETSDLGVFELLHEASSSLPSPKHSRDPKHPIDRGCWESWFDVDSGRPKIPFDEFKKEVFRRGLKPDVRRKVWPFLLGVLLWDVDMEERAAAWEDKKAHYEEIKAEWCGVDKVFNREDVLEERHRIDVDCRRTDRTQPLFAQPATGTPGSGNVVSTSNEEIGAQAASNEHVESLAMILLTYNFYEKQLGYVQGMSDLCAPLYVVTGADEAATFWCFVAVMDNMKQNFLRDQSGMKKQLLTLQQLLAVMDPQLYRHLEKAEALNLFFCFRWVLIHFKREFAFEEVLRLWEVLWTSHYTKDFVLFVALAILESHRDVIMRYLIEFDEILKYCNELSGTIELDSTLAQAEVLFLSFRQIIEDVDRRTAEQDTPATQVEGLRQRKGGTMNHNGKVLSLPVISDNLRALLGDKEPAPSVDDSAALAEKLETAAE